MPNHRYNLRDKTSKKSVSHVGGIEERLERSPDQWPAELAAKMLGVSVDPKECKNIVAYEFPHHMFPHNMFPPTFYRLVTGLPAGPNGIYEFIDYNLRSKEPTVIPEGSKKARGGIDKKYQIDPICGSKKLLLSRKLLPTPTHTGAQIYKTHDNGARPFMVYITESTVHVYVVPTDEYAIPDLLDSYGQSPFFDSYGQYRDWMYSKLVFECQLEQVWIGKSNENEITAPGGGHGEDYDGNTILIKEKVTPPPEGWTHSYVLVGSSIARYRTNDEIKSFVADVGNNDVPYPYARDIKGATYLFIEAVKMTNPLPPKYASDPYQFYYDHFHLTADRALGPREEHTYEFEKAMIGDERFTFTWTPHPDRAYDSLIDRKSAPLRVTQNGNERELTKETFRELMHDFQRRMGWETLEKTELVARDV